MRLLDSLKWRYATKKFDKSKIINDKDITQIEEAVKLSASSYGFQPYTILRIKNPQIRKLLQPISWNQSQIVDASHLYVFCNYVKFSDEKVDEYVQRKSDIQNITLEKLEGYKQFMKDKLKEKSKDEIPNWTAKQTYIALANMISACAELKIDSCPIEGFEPQEYDKVLELEEKGLTAAVVMAIGYHAEDDHNYNMKKVRKSINTLFKTI